MSYLAPRLGWYWFRSGFRRHLAGYLTLVVLLGLVGGLSIGSIAAARRTQSSFGAFLASTDPSDMVIHLDDSADDDNRGDAAFLRAVAALPQVRRVESATSLSAMALGADGEPSQSARLRLFNSTVIVFGSVDGLFGAHDRPAVVEGRPARPTRADEMVMDVGAAGLLHLRIGDVVTFGIYTNAQTLLDGYGTSRVRPHLRIGVRLVGLVAPSHTIVRDDFDRGQSFALMTPALMRPLLDCCANGPISGLGLTRGGRDVASVAAELRRISPKASVLWISAVDAAKANRAIEPESIALGAFGAIAGLAALLIAGQLIARQLREGAEERQILRALGAGRAMRMSGDLTGIVAAVMAGSMLAAGVAVAGSALAPVGPVRPIYPRPGIAFDWTVLAAGSAVLMLVLTAGAVISCWRLDRRGSHRGSLTGRLGPATSRAAARSGLSVAAVTGISLAFDSRGGRQPAPIRSAILGSVLAVTVAVATVTFAASLHTVVSHPRLYGWNWDVELLAPYGGFADVPQPQTDRLLRRDHDVAAWSGVDFDIFQIDGLTVPIMGERPHAAVAPPVLTGHGIGGPRQIVLGGTTLTQLRKHVGDTVEVTARNTKPVRLQIVGTATLPAIGITLDLHLEIGSGAIVPDALIPTADRGFGDLVDSPQAVFIRFRPGVDRTASLRALRGTAKQLDVLGHGPPSVVMAQRPAEIVNYRSLATIPTFLGATLGAGAMGALGLALIASVRRRRHDLALLKTLGFSRRQLAAVVVWQSTLVAVIGGLAGVPLGIVTGRWLWTLFSRQIQVVPQPTVPGGSVALIALGTLALANLVAALPARLAARAPVALSLRAE
ncbi:MAG: hypothetical protein JWM05_1012 [Acidimicrobiales bacterium]|nr:hypothetical protein [Acidimicrobiales bacterium]